MLFGVNMALCDKVNVRRATLLIKPDSKRSQRFCRRRSFIILSACCWINLLRAVAVSGVKLNVTRREALKIDLTIGKAAGGPPEGNHERIWSILEYCCCWKYSVRKVIKKKK